MLNLEKPLRILWLTSAFTFCLLLTPLWIPFLLFGSNYLLCFLFMSLSLSLGCFVFFFFLLSNFLLFISPISTGAFMPPNAFILILLFIPRRFVYLVCTSNASFGPFLRLRLLPVMLLLALYFFSVSSVFPPFLFRFYSFLISFFIFLFLLSRWKALEKPTSQALNSKH